MEDIEDPWPKIKEILQSDIPFQIYYEVPLPLLGSLLWPEASFQELKSKNKLLAAALRKRNIIIRRKRGRRYALIPQSLVNPKKRRVRIEVEEVWRW